MQRNKGKRYGTIESRVAKGATWLDKVRPGWFKNINLDKLQLSDGCHCVLGQIVKKEFGAASKFGDMGYSEVVVRQLLHRDWRKDIVDHKAKLGPIDGLAKLVIPGITAKRRGFELTKFQDYAEWNSLTEEWKRQITARREAVSASV